jgi:restriction endonuclease Mrr
MNKATASKFASHYSLFNQDIKSEIVEEKVDAHLQQLRSSLQKIESLMDRFAFSLHEIQSAFHSPFVRKTVIRTLIQQKRKNLKRERLSARTGRAKFQLVRSQIQNSPSKNQPLN